jgi:hypothetical protein
VTIGRSGDERGDGVMRRAVVSSSQRECRLTKARAGTELVVRYAVCTDYCIVLGSGRVQPSYLFLFNKIWFYL